MLRRCVERAGRRSSSLIISDMRAPGRHLTIMHRKDYPLVPPWDQHTLFIETCVPKKGRKGWSLVEALLLRKSCVCPQR